MYTEKYNQIYINSSNLKLAVDTEVTSYEKSLNVFDYFNFFVRSSVRASTKMQVRLGESLWS